MARQKTSVEYNNFTKGFITEASPLTFPENASLDEENMNINRDGSRQRRFGITWASNAHIISDVTPISVSEEATNSFTWKSAGNDGNVNLGVLQKGKSLYFFDLDDTDPASAFLTTYTFSVLDVPAGKEKLPFDFASAYGKLLVTVDSAEVHVFTWTGAVVTDNAYKITIRDLFGVDDGFAVDFRPTGATIPESHWYNLRNQGWPKSTRLANTTGAGGQPGGAATDGDPIQNTYDNVAFWPSNADLIWSIKMENLGTASGWIDSFGAFDPNEMTKQHFGSTPAPKGRYIIDLFERGAARMSQSGRVGLPQDETTGGINSIASFAGRIWYAVDEESLISGDDNSPNIGNMIFYSQATEEEIKWGACYSENDITSEDFNQTLASDGGYISIPECGTVYNLVPLGESLFVFASNGVWEIFGGDQGFSAEVQTIVKVTDVGAISNRSITTGDNLIGYWTESGIYGISLDQTSLRGVVNNLTENTIQSFYDEIPLFRKILARGSYDYLSKQATWLYSVEDLGSPFYYDRELVLDLRTGAFTKRTFPGIERTTGNGPYVCAYLNLRNLLDISTEVPVTAQGVPVSAGGVLVTVGETDAEQATKSSTMYWIANWDNITPLERFRLGGYLNFEFDDWNFTPNDELVFGNDSPAFILTGSITGGDSSKDKLMPYVSVRMKRTETAFNVNASDEVEVVGASGCLMSSQWDWTNDPLSYRWSRPQQVYKLPRAVYYNTGDLLKHDVVRTRNKIRGMGKAVSLKFESEPKKDMFIYGWGMDVILKRET